MPRAYATIDNNYDEVSDPIDLCLSCWPQRLSHILSMEYTDFEDVQSFEHPDYDEGTLSGADYSCDKCGRALTAEDD